MKKIIDLYNKYREIINYLIAGVLTTIVGLLSFEMFLKVFHIHYIISNVLSWIAAVTFAYVVNRRYVFNSKTNGNEQLKEVINFFKYRVVSLIIETVCLYLLVDICKFNTSISKIVMQFVVIVLNYIFSKFFTFKNNN